MANYCINKHYPRFNSLSQKYPVSSSEFEIECYKVVNKYEVFPLAGDAFYDMVEYVLDLKFGDIVIDDLDFFYKLESKYNELKERLDNGENLSIGYILSQYGSFNAFTYEDKDGNIKIFLKKPVLRSEQSKDSYFVTENIDSDIIDIEHRSKPLKGDEFYQNKTLRIYLKDNHKDYIEIIKDNDNNNYYINVNTLKDIESKDNYKILFLQLKDAIPYGSFISFKNNISEDFISIVNDEFKDMIKIDGDSKNTVFFKNHTKESAENILISDDDNIINVLENCGVIERKKDKHVLSGSLTKENGVDIINSFLIANKLPLDRIIINEEKEVFLNEFKEDVNSNDDIIGINDNCDSIIDIAKFLKLKFKGLDVIMINQEKAKEILGGKYSDDINSFNLNGIAYLIEGKVTNESAAEECLHPLVMTLAHTNTQLFNDLYEEAVKNFPKLKKLIDDNYSELEGYDLKLELVCQALSKCFAKKYEKAPTSTLLNLIKKIINAIKNLFKKSIDVSRLKNMNLQQLSDLILTTESQFAIEKSNLLFLNKKRVFRRLNDYNYVKFDEDTSHPFAIAYKVSNGKIILSKKTNLFIYRRKKDKVKEIFRGIYNDAKKNDENTKQTIDVGGSDFNLSDLDSDKLINLIKNISNNYNTNDGHVSGEYLLEQVNEKYYKLDYKFDFNEDNLSEKTIRINYDGVPELGYWVKLDKNSTFVLIKNRRVFLSPGHAEKYNKIYAEIISLPFFEFDNISSNYFLKSQYNGDTVVIPNPDVVNTNDRKYYIKLVNGKPKYVEINDDSIYEKILDEVDFSKVINVSSVSKKNGSIPIFLICKVKLESLKKVANSMISKDEKTHKYTYRGVEYKTSASGFDSNKRDNRDKTEREKIRLWLGNEYDDLFRKIFPLLNEDGDRSILNSIPDDMEEDDIFEYVQKASLSLKKSIDDIYSKKLDKNEYEILLKKINKKISIGSDNDTQITLLNYIVYYAYKIKKEYGYKKIGFYTDEIYLGEQFTKLDEYGNKVSSTTIFGTPDMIIYGMDNNYREKYVLCDFKTSARKIDDYSISSYEYDKQTFLYSLMINELTSSDNSDGKITIDIDSGASCIHIFPLNINSDEIEKVPKSHRDKLSALESITVDFNDFFNDDQKNKTLNVDVSSVRSKYEIDNESELFNDFINSYKTTSSAKILAIMDLVSKGENEESISIDEQVNQEVIDTFNSLGESITKIKSLSSPISKFNPIYDPEVTNSFSRKLAVRTISSLFSKYIDLIIYGGDFEYYQNAKDLYEKVGKYMSEHYISDISVYSRQWVLENIIGDGSLYNGVKTVLLLVKDLFDPDNIKDEEYEVEKNNIGIVFKYFDYYVEEASSKILQQEGILIKAKQMNALVIEDMEGDDYAEKTEEEVPDFLFNIKEKNTYDSMSLELRNAFETIFYAEDRTPDDSDFVQSSEVGSIYGLSVPVTGRVIVNNILNWCYKCRTIDEMAQVIASKYDTCPYVLLILEKIGYYIKKSNNTNEDGKYIAVSFLNNGSEMPKSCLRLRSLFFLGIKKGKVEYKTIIVEVNKDDDGDDVFEIKVKDVNTNEAYDKLYNSVSSVFNGNANLSLMSSRITDAWVLSKISELFNRKLTWSYFNGNSKDTIKNVVLDTIELFDRFGIELEEDTIMQFMSSTGKQKNIDKGNLVSHLDGIIKSIKDCQSRYNIDIMANLNNDELNNSFVISKKDSIISDYKQICKILSEYSVGNIENCAREGDKNYQTFLPEGFLDEMMNHFNGSLSYEDCKNYIEKNYGTKRGFLSDYDSKGRLLYIPYYLNLLYNKESYSHFSDTFKMAQITGIRYPKKDLVEYMKMDDISYAISIFAMFKRGKEGYFYTPFPIMADKPVSDFVLVPYIKDLNLIKSEMFKTFRLELNRMRTIFERAKQNLSESNDIRKPGYILNYDITKNDLEASKITTHSRCSLELFRNILRNSKKSNGFRFFFTKELNDILCKTKNISEEEKEFLTLVDLYLQGDSDYDKLNSCFKSIFSKIMDKRVENNYNFYKDKGILNALFEHNIITRAEVEEDLFFKYYVYNQMFATTNLIQLTVTDPAFFKNIEDFQKRYALIHAPSLKLNKDAIWQNYINGKKDLIDAKEVKNYTKITDGFIRSLVLSDEIIKSQSFGYILLIFNKKIKEAKNESERIELETIKSLFLEVNVTDSLAYSCATSMRKKLIMTGVWTWEHEAAYDRIINGKYSVNDIKLLILPLKPFSYGKVNYRNKTNSNCFEEINTPIQNKNSEYMLFLTNALIKGSQANKEIKQNCRLTAIYDFMEFTHYEGRKIIRAGDDGQLYVVSMENGLIHKELYNYNYENGGLGELLFKPEDLLKLNGVVLNVGTYKTDGIDTVVFESAIKNGLNSSVSTIDNDGLPLSYESMLDNLANNAYEYNGKTYNDKYVFTMDFENYGIQQNVPGHQMDHQQLMGSQEKVLAITDFEYNEEHPDSEDNFVSYYLPIKDKNGNQVFAKSRIDGTFLREYELLLSDNVEDSYNELLKDFDGKDENEKKRKLSNLLLSQIDGDARYSYDLKWAVLLHEDLDGNLLFNVPLSDPVLGSRILSLLNSIIKTRVHQLKIKGGPTVLVSLFGMSDSLLVKFDENGNFLYYEVYATPQDSDLAERITFKESGIYTYKNDDGEEISEYFEAGEYMPVNYALQNNIINEEELKVIAYRIPTEDKYSMLPCRIKGFLSRTSGEAFIMPADITVITGSDFDVDKMYLIYKEFYHKNKRNTRKAPSEVFYKNEESIDDFYDRKKSRNNKIFNMMYAALTHNQTKEKMFNPGNFDIIKKPARISYILNNINNISDEKIKKEIIEDPVKFFLDKTWKKLDDIMSLSLSSSINDPLTLIYLHKQNSSAKTLISIFAVNSISHAFFSLEDKFTIKILPECGFTFNGEKLEEKTEYDFDRIRNRSGKFISKITGSFVDGSVDAVKDPCINFININEVTCNVAMMLVRMGFDVLTIGLFLSHPEIVNCVNKYINKSSITYTSLLDVISDRCKELRDPNSHGLNLIDANILCSFTDKELMELIIKYNTLDKNNNEDVKSVNSYSFKILLNFANMYKHNDAVRGLSELTKYNSMSSAAGPSLAETLNRDRKVRLFINNYSTVFSYINKIENDSESTDDILFFEHHPLLKSLKERIYGSYINKSETSLPMYEIGMNGLAYTLFNNKFITSTRRFNDILNYIEDNYCSPNSRLNDSDIKTIANDLMLFLLTKPIIEGKDAFISKSDYKYLTSDDFVNEFLRIKSKNPNNALLNAINVKTVSLNVNGKKIKKRVLVTNISKSNEDYLDELRLAWAELSVTDGCEVFSKNLFKYNMTRSSFTFSPKTFLHIAPSIIKNLYIDYLAQVQDIVSNFDKNSYFNDYYLHVFVDLFIRNHSDMNKLCRKVPWTFLVSSNERNVNFGTIIIQDSFAGECGEYVKYNDNIYKYIGHQEGNSSEKSGKIYNITSTLGSLFDFYEYQYYGGVGNLSLLNLENHSIIIDSSDSKMSFSYGTFMANPYTLNISGEYKISDIINEDLYVKLKALLILDPLGNGGKTEITEDDVKELIKMFNKTALNYKLNFNITENPRMVQKVDINEVLTLQTIYNILDFVEHNKTVYC